MQKEQLLEICEYAGDGYAPVIDYGEWRVAILKYCDELRIENIRIMQRHDETDEVFVLLKGRCLLFIGEGRDIITNILAEEMKPNKLYNVKRSVWHNHTLSKDAVVLIIENRNTGLTNSTDISLSDSQQAEIIKRAYSYGYEISI